MVSEREEGARVVVIVMMIVNVMTGNSVLVYSGEEVG